MRRSRRIHRWGGRRSSLALLLATFVIVTAGGTATAQEAPLAYYLEGGGSFVHFTNDYGNGNGQFVAFSVSRNNDFNLRFDLGRAQRFGDEGVGVGGLFTKYLAGGWGVEVGASTGTGRFIFPEYRVNAAVSKALLAKGNLQAVLGYVHEQSKAENYFDRIAASLNWWANSHWIYGAYFNYDIGQPGNTKTLTGGVGVTWFEWNERFLGVTVEYGDVNYTQIAETDFLVGYEQFLLIGFYTEYFNPTFGMNIRLDVGTNEFYDIYGITASIFKSW